MSIDCKEIVDLLYPYGEEPEKIVCLECGSENLRRWTPRTGKGPKCGEKMEKTDLLIIAD